MQPSHSPQETNFTYVQRDECALTTIYAWREDVERFLNGAQNSESRKSSVREMILAVERKWTDDGAQKFQAYFIRPQN